jgi:hypothetical protein
MKKFHFKDLFRIFVITACVITGFSPTGCMKPLDYTELLEFKPSVYPSTIDFNISGLGTYICGEEYTIAVTPKPDMTQGNITIYYEGYNYLKSNVPPVSAGAYTVTFNVEKAKGFFAVSGMVAGLLMINNPVYNTPKKEDFAIDGLGPYTLGDTLDVSIKPNPNMTKGHITILYERYDYPISADPPSAAGAYTVTFNVDVDDAGKFNAIYGLFAGTLIINNPDPPKKEGFVVSGLDKDYKLEETINVTVNPIDDRLKGKVTIFYEGYNHQRSATPPGAAGVYTVTFDVAAVEGYSVAAYGLVAGTLTIYIPVYHTPIVTDFKFKGLGEYLFNGSSREVKIETINNEIKGGTTVYYTSMSVAATPITSPPPSAVGIYTVTFDVDESSGYNIEAKGLLAGTIIINKKGAELIGYKEPENPYTLTSDDGSSVSNIKDILNNNPNSFFELDFTDSNISSITGGIFQGNNITSITIDSDSINEISGDAFRDCTSLKEVTIKGNGNTIISGSVFWNCTSLESVYIEDIEEIRYNAFTDCINLKEVTIIGNGSTKIYSGVFSGCKKLENVHIENVQTINGSAFSNCTDIKNLYLGNGLKEISESSFKESTKLENVTFGGTIPSSGFPTSNYAFPPSSTDLRDKFYETDPVNGTPGTYITSNGGSTWKKQ